MKRVIPGDRPNECFICGRWGTETHHIFGASDRDASERYGLKVNLCENHHRGTYGAHGREGKGLQEFLHQTGQETIEDIWKREGTENPREKFRQIFRRSYLEDDKD